MIRTLRVSPIRAWRAAGLVAACAAFLMTPAAMAAPATERVAAAHEPHPIAIGDARAMPLGTVVTVEGTVTVDSGAFSSSSFDEGFAIQDHTGGIYVSVATDLGLDVPQRVLVTGQLVDSFGLLTLVPAADSGVEVEGHGRRVKPLWVRTGSVGPANQGLIVRVVGVITQPVEPDPPFGNKVFVDDGSGPIRVFVNTSTGIDVSGLAQGQLLSVVGFSSAFNDPEIDPRFQSDLTRPDTH
ncbi:MAG TPA: hypothetical protein VE075_12060 [Thermoanaerobaculia bacterium]|nr:hypothetical protein [Thermoanaerobaculia bacterium]